MSEIGPRARREAEFVGRRDPFWPAQLTVAAAIALALDLPSRITIAQVWLLPAIEGVLLVGLVMSTPWVPLHRHAERRRVALALVGLVTASNLVNLGLLIHDLLHKSLPGHALLLAGVEIWLTNVLLFTVLYWELDRGGPIARQMPEMQPPDFLKAPDFLFPQMTEEKLGGIDWRACYIDYLYTSFTNATAFSPTDTMPLTPPAKLLMLVQSGASLLTLGVVFARAINILNIVAK
ncbi:MAG TPA: hypothetical protein VGG41_19370 [Solirubrobacteraceae bacterium]|jgi:uncharacterized membrane protein